MILFSFRERPETRPNMPCSAFRWTFQLTQLKDGMSAGFVWQCRSKNGWHSTDYSYEVGITTRWGFGVKYCYYDGPHHLLDIGPLHIWWPGKDEEEP